MKSKYEWRENPCFLTTNYVLDVNEKYFLSYNPCPGGGITVFASDDNGPETAIVDQENGKYYILNGDFRKTYVNLLKKGGIKACLDFYKLHEGDQSTWSTGTRLEDFIEKRF